MNALRLAFLLPALIAVAPAHAEESTRPTDAPVQARPITRHQHHRLERMIREFARQAEEKRAHATMLARR